jgi:hypothetical protein
MAEPLVAFTKFYLSYHEAMAELSDEQYGRVSRAINNYELYGKEPVLTGVEMIIFTMARPTIDSSVNSRINGKKGGAPRGNTNARKTRGVKQKNNPPYSDKTTNDNGNDNDNGNVKDKVNVKDNGDGNMDLKNHSPPPQILQKIISESHRLEFIIDDKKAIEFYNSGIDPAWYNGPYSFLALAAEKTKEQYPNKSHGQQQNLFNNAVISWKNLRYEYPLWLKEQKEIAKKNKQEKSLQKLKEKMPTRCQCGGKLDENLFCKKCHGFYTLNQKTMEPEFTPGITEKNWESVMLEKRRLKNGGGMIYASDGKAD